MTAYQGDKAAETRIDFRKRTKVLSKAFDVLSL
jgi:hypothetical protein